MKNFFICIFLILFVFSSQAFAAKAMLDVSGSNGGKNIIFDQKSKRSQYITVKNIGKVKGYVAIKVYNPLESRVGQDQKSTLKKSYKMIISPRRMILKPGQSKRIRITNLTGPVKTERVIDVVVNLVQPFNSKKAEDLPTGAMGIAVKGSIIHVVQIHVLPKQLSPEIAYKVEENSDGQKEIKFTNNGNISLTFVAGEVCKKSDDCVSLTSFRIYPQQKKNIMIPASYQNGTITYTQRSESGNENINFPAS